MAIYKEDELSLGEIEIKAERLAKHLIELEKH